MGVTANSLIDELSSLSQQPDFASNPKLRTKAVELNRQIAVQLQDPADVALELSLFPTYALAARIAVDMKLFNLIAASSTPVSAADLAMASSGSEKLIVRLLRPLAALGFVQEICENTWAANPVTEIMCTEPMRAGHIHLWDQCNGSMAKMVSYFRANGYIQPDDPCAGPLQYAFGTEKNSFDHWRTQPEVIDNFNTFMTGVRAARPSWLDWWPVESQIFKIELKDSDTLFVDVAGGRGHDLLNFKNKFPDKKGRLVLEDLPAVIDGIPTLDERIIVVKYDFFTPQPVKDALIYFFHFIMHDWSDDVCVKILSHTASAMKRGHSKVLINDFILPNEFCPLAMCGFDLAMMALHSGQERTESQWRALVARAGLEVLQVWSPENGGEGIVECQLI
ncbi:S-adenosyl-L-methionine-dependent methyltransferase [Lindgomyces ingoldianus]|uniref:S-adenosyl-L-methionine-dependent methyltransferase n=1 Tax=Lindgomyces ingoldianus TaxID=673940 RepID=A0ACB6R2U9_9PLEO|nr:S-adenosyl-L-methionine-dependent methyltransferase [Lindgomyces ingoldianus]KAF2472655.1 S-adenosyl-L-methionine-dependent methyltransferase [Lindgomyces ingoldianus]